MSSGRKATKTRALVEAAVMIALAQILSFLIIYRAPYGGSVDLAMLPIIFFAVRWGPSWGFGAGLVFGYLQSLVSFGLTLSWVSIFGDYLIAFGVLGLAGFFQGRRYGIYYGSIVGCIARFIIHFITGITIWAQYMPDTFSNVWVYSAVYNGTYMLPDLIIAIVVFALLYKPLKKYMLGEDIIKNSV